MKVSTFLKPLSFIPALLLMYMIYSFSAQDAEQSTSTSYKASREIVTVYDSVTRSGMEDWQIDQKASSINKYVRKAAHVTEYFLLAVAVSFPLYVYGVRGILLMLTAGLICVGYAMGDEYHQTLVAGRGPSMRDVGIDSIGVIFGILLVRIMGWSTRVAVTGPRMEREQKRREEELDSREAELRRREQQLERRERREAAEYRRYREQPLRGENRQTKPENSGDIVRSRQYRSGMPGRVEEQDDSRQRRVENVQGRVSGGMEPDSRQRQVENVQGRAAGGMESDFRQRRGENVQGRASGGMEPDSRQRRVENVQGRVSGGTAADLSQTRIYRSSKQTGSCDERTRIFSSQQPAADMDSSRVYSHGQYGEGEREQPVEAADDRGRRYGRPGHDMAGDDWTENSFRGREEDREREARLAEVRRQRRQREEEEGRRRAGDAEDSTADLLSEDMPFFSRRKKK